MEDWLLSYRPRELFDEKGQFREKLAAPAPSGHRRISANPHANGGALLRPLTMPNYRDYAVKVSAPGSVAAESTRVLGKLLRDVMKWNQTAKNFPLFGPGETASNRREAVYQVTRKS